MDNMLLPIGTVCTLKDSNKKLMITSFMVKKEENSDKYYDYCGCYYPEGIINSEMHFVFDRADIKTVHHLGYFNEEEEEFKTNLYKLINAEQVSTNSVESQPNYVNNNVNVTPQPVNPYNTTAPQFFSNGNNV